MQPVPFPSRKNPAFFLLICSTKVESRNIGTCIEHTSANHHLISSAGKYLVNSLIIYNRFVSLICITDFYRFTNREASRINLFESKNHLEECGFSCTIWTDHTNNTVWRQYKFKIFEQ